jgi:hypothetical protein
MLVDTLDVAIRRSVLILAALAANLIAGPSTLAQDDVPSFDRDIAPILIDRCLDCHSGAEPKGGLDLAVAESARKGGQSGTAIVPGKLDASLLWERIESGEMPPKAKLTDQEKQSLKEWISSGAKWGTTPIDPFRVTTNRRAGSDWWSLKSIQRPDVPQSAAGQSVRNPIDSFVLKRLEDRGFMPSQQATSRELIRRVHFDLIGLPPTPAEVRDFEQSFKQDSDAAWKQLVDKLLGSKHFGERWGRHWLDVVRFGESQGFERDKLRDNSWNYRDWVIDAFNRDLPYDEFVRQQIAGDILYPGEPNAITATGFLVAGPWDEPGQNMRSAPMKAVVRQDEIEDYVGTIGQTFLGLTVNCARCHDHKFDPIRQKEYYQLASAVGGVRHGSRDVISQDDQREFDRINAQMRQAQDDIANIDGAVRNRLLKANSESSTELPAKIQPIARWDFQKDTNDGIGKLHATQHPKAKVVDGRLILDGGTGYATTRHVDRTLREKTLEAWVKLDNLEQRGGAAISVHSTKGPFDAIVFGERESGKWMAGSDYFKRTKNLNAPQETEAVDGFVHVAISYDTDGTIACYRNGKPYGKPYQSKGLIEFRPGQWYVMFGLRTGGPNSNRQLRGLLEAAQLYDRALSASEVLASFECEKAAITHESILAALTDEESTSRDQQLASIKSLERKRQQHASHSVYAVVPTAADTVSLLLRGNPATPGGVASINGVDADFQLAPDAPDADRRRKLAEWITDKQNPMFSRVIVNRLWHYHFGIGIVDSPNDFGFNGGRPSHPQLLDWLAAELIDSGWSLKHIHRLIVNSATYRQSSTFNADAAKIDSDNRLLWRKNPGRLEAEALRDCILSVSGQLNRQYGGAPYRDFTTYISNSQFYKMIDPDSPDVYRRTIYRTWIRSGRNHMLDAFDCPDPSSTAPRRAVTTTPIQSLTLMNNSFVLRMSGRFAERVIVDVRQRGGKDTSNDASSDASSDVDAQADRVFQLAFSRSPSPEELEDVTTFIEEHGLEALCRVVLNSNEFIHVD